MPQQRVQKPRTTQHGSPPAESALVKPTKSAEELKAETDALLDEIDEVLEENAEEFVAAYVQKGGQ